MSTKIKTITWHASAGLRKFLATNFSKNLSIKMHNFCSMLELYNPVLPEGRLFVVCETQSENIADETLKITAMQDKCLFNSSACGLLWEIVLDLLVRFNTEKKVYEKQLWYFADMEEKAVVCFYKDFDNQWAAKIYCQSLEETSALHLCTVTEGNMRFDFCIPVYFGDISNQITEAKVAGLDFLRDYLPHEKLDLLSKKGKVAKKGKEDSSSVVRKRDKQDSL